MSNSNYPKEFPCPICGFLCRVGISKKEKPYFTCLDCGVQVFIRSPEGVQKFSSFKDSDLLKMIKNKNAAVYSEILFKRDVVEVKEEELNELQKNTPFLGNKEIENKIKEKELEIKELKDEYLQILKN